MVMSDLTTGLQQKFAEDIAAKYPLHKILMLFLVMFSFYIDNNFDKTYSILSILDRIELRALFDPQKGIFTHMTFQDLLFSTVIVGLVCLIYERYSLLLYSMTNKTLESNYLDRLHNAAIKNISSDSSQNIEFSKEVRDELGKSKVFVKKKSQHNEILVAVIIALLINYRFLDGVVEHIVLLGLALFVIYNIREVNKHYVSVLIPMYVQLAVLLGNKVSFPDVKEIHKDDAIQ